MAALIAAIGETPLKSELDKLERHIAAYHFPEALSALSQIAQEMEIADINSASADSDDGGETRS